MLPMVRRWLKTHAAAQIEAATNGGEIVGCIDDISFLVSAEKTRCDGDWCGEQRRQT
jgi:hypothetical protein